MKSNEAQLCLTTEIKDELNGGDNNDSLQHFECPYYEEKLAKADSLSLSTDITDLSIAKLTLKSLVLDDRSADCGLHSNFDTASTSAEIGSYPNFKHVDCDSVINRHSKENKPKSVEREKILDIFGEYDEIDGIVFHSFTSMDRLEKFVARSARVQAMNPASSLSFHEAKDKSYCQTSDPSSRDFFREDTGRIDASFLILPEELYCENYDVPCSEKPRKRQVVGDCEKTFCSMGCICESLNSTKPPLAHCNHPECMCLTVCIYKSSLGRPVPTSSTENDTSREFSGFDLSYADQVPPEQWLLLKNQLDLQKEIIHHLQLQLDRKQLEINQLKNQIMEKSTVKNTADLRPRVPTKNMAPLSVKKVKTKMEAKVKANVETTMKSKGKAKVDTRLHMDGHYVDSFPFDEKFLDRLSENTTVTGFIRQLMRNMFTVNFLSSKSSRWMKKEHFDAIIDATLKRFELHWRRNGDSIPVTVEMVKQVITSEFNLKQTRKKLLSNRQK